MFSEGTNSRISWRFRARQHLASSLRSLSKRLRNSEATVGIGLAILVGLLSGLGAVAFIYMIKAFQWVFFNQGATALKFLHDYYVILLPVMGGLIIGPLIYLLAREAKGDGPPEVMEAAASKVGVFVRVWRQ